MFADRRGRDHTHDRHVAPDLLVADWYHVDGNLHSPVRFGDRFRAFRIASAAVGEDDDRLWRCLAEAAREVLQRARQERVVVSRRGKRLAGAGRFRGDCRARPSTQGGLCLGWSPECRVNSRETGPTGTLTWARPPRRGSRSVSRIV